ncbi:MAG: hypothetical protein FGM54_03640 [Chitinophagaceae bacterium]|nr:hypothetical protein [Chitinophagaceae bacterium]
MITQHFIQQFDYSVNPIFSEHTERVFSDADNIAIYEQIRRIDFWVDVYLTEKHLVKKTQIEQTIQKSVQAIRVILHARTQTESLLRQAVDVCLEEAHQYVLRLMQFSEYPSYSYKSGQAVSFDTDRYNHMVQHGYCEYQLPETTAFKQYCQLQMEEARMKYRDTDDWRGANWEGYDKTEGYQILKNFILDQHILDLVSAYKGKEMEFKYIAWDYNHHRQLWFKNVNGVEKRSPTNYYHFDADPNVAKMMIYLSDVNETDGPFRYVKGSHSLARSPFTIGLHYGVDAKVNPLVPAPFSRFRRNAFTHNRALLMQLPHAFLGSTHFGDDLVENSALSRYLLDNTVVFTRPAGAGIVFDGYLGVHAGGNPISGERLAVQVGFIQKKPKTSNNVQRNSSLFAKGKRFIKGQLLGKK